jgi:hypothetical protein
MNHHSDCVQIFLSQDALRWELNQSNVEIERLQEQLKEGTEIEAASFKSQLASMHLNEVQHTVIMNHCSHMISLPQHCTKYFERVPRISVDC